MAGRRKRGRYAQQDSSVGRGFSQSMQRPIAWLLGVIVLAVIAGVCVWAMPWATDSLRNWGAGAGPASEHLVSPADTSTGAVSTLPLPEAAPAEPVPVPPESSASSPRSPVLPPDPSAMTVEALQQEALDVAGHLRKVFPQSSDTIAFTGMVHNWLGNAKEAMECWQKCLERNPKRADVYGAMGGVALRQGKDAEAVELFRTALEIDPKLLRGHTRLAQALMGLGRTKEAIAALEQGVQISPPQREDHCLLGKAYLQLAECDKARKSYETALDLQPDDAEACYGLGAAWARLGEQQKSREYLEKFKRFRAVQQEAHMGRRSQATDRSEIARIVAEAHTGAGRVYRGYGYLEVAEQHWRRAAALDPENTACRQELAALYEQTGREQQAVEVCEQLRRIDPKNPQYHLNTGVLYARMNRMDAAVSAVKQAVELAPENAKYRRVYEQIRAAN